MNYQNPKGLLVFSLVLLGLVLSSCKKNEQPESESKLKLLEAISVAKQVMSNLKEGTEEGASQPGTKELLQDRINWANFILQSSGTEIAYANAAHLLEDFAMNAKTNLVRKGVPNFTSGSYFNLGAVGKLIPNKANFTIQCMVRLRDLSVDASNGLGSFISADDNDIGILLRYTNGGDVEAYINDSGWMGASVGGGLDLDTWKEVSYTFDGNYIKVFIDGIERASEFSATPKVAQIADENAPVHLGAAQHGAFGGSMHGNIRNVRFWDHALTASEISQNLDMPLKGNEKGLIACWPLDLNLGNTVRDKTGNFTAIGTNVLWQQ